MSDTLSPSFWYSTLKDAQRRLKQASEEETKGKAASQTLHEISALTNEEKLRFFFWDYVPPLHLLDQNRIKNLRVDRKR